MARLRTHVGRARRIRLTTGGPGAALSPHPSYEPTIFEPGFGPPKGGRNPGTTTHYAPGHAPTTVQHTAAGHPSVVRTDPASGASTPSYVPGSTGGGTSRPAPSAPPLAPLAPLVSPIARLLGATHLLPAPLSAPLSALGNPSSPAAQLLDQLLGRNPEAKPAPSPAAREVRHQLVSLGAPAPKHFNPADPLGARTPGTASLVDLAKAGREGGLKVSPTGRITTPQERDALHQLHAAQRAVAAQSGIQGITHGEAATRFADALTHDTGLDPRFVGAWVQTEGAGETGNTGGEAGPNNWLGVGYPAHRTPFSESSYFSGSPEQAAKATADWMKGLIGAEYGYPASSGIRSIIPAAAGKGPQAALQALSASGWGTNVSDVASNLAGISAAQPQPAALHQLAVAKQNARGLGINPTPFNGDVAGGGPEYTIVRADAKGMVQWAESALGTQEGSGKQLRWAGKLGLGSTEPWCANFVSNGLLRRGFTPAELPSNPNNTGTPGYEQWATEGRYARNLGTDLSKAKPGDILTFSGAHTALYVGNGEMISGNFSNEVERTPVSAGPAALSMIIRPDYKGGQVKIADSQLVGSTAASALGSSGFAGAPAPGSSGAAGIAGAQPVAMPLTPLSSPLSAGPVMPSDLLGAEPHASAAQETLGSLLGEEELPAATRRPILG